MIPPDPMRDYARAAILADRERRAPAPQSAAIAIPYDIACQIARATFISSAKLYEIAAHLAQQGYLSALSAPVGAPGAAAPVESCHAEPEKKQ